MRERIFIVSRSDWHLSDQSQTSEMSVIYMVRQHACSIHRSSIVMFIGTLDMAERPSKCARKSEASAERGVVVEETQASPVAGAAPRRFSSINFGTHAPARSSPRDGEAHASPASATPTGATQASYTPTRDYTPIPRSSELWKDHDYNDGPPASPSTTEEHTLLDARSSAVGGATEQAAPATGASAERLRWLLRGTRSWVDEGKILAG